MSLETQMADVVSGLNKNAPEDVKNAIFEAKTDIQTSFDYASAIQVGDVLPRFKLLNALNENVSSEELLKRGPILITFYRGTWCPFCNIALAHLQKKLADFSARGVTLVAISPELPDTSLSESEKRGLTFPVLSDVGNSFARELGIVWKQPDSLRPVFDKFGNSLLARNGDDSLEVPIPATILVDTKGVVRKTFIEADYMKRLDPEVALGWVDE